MTRVCTISATDLVRPRTAGRRRGAAAWTVLALLVSGSTIRAASETTPADLRSLLEKTDKTLAQAEKAIKDTYPGKVSFILIRLDELLDEFQKESGLENLVKTFDDSRTAATASDLTAASAGVRRASSLMTPVIDYVALRQAAETSRAALRAADAHDGPAFMEALDRFDAAILAPVLLARVRETRAAVARTRQSMVRNNMPEGRQHLAEARRGLNGLVYAGALTRGSFSLSIGSELLESRSIIAARDQLQKGMRDLKLAAETGPEEARPALEECRGATLEIWKRSSHPQPEDPARLLALARRVEDLRLKQPR